MTRAWLAGLSALAVLLSLPVSGQGAGPAPAGVGVTASFLGQSYLQAPEMAAAGIRWVRLDLAWSSAEQRPEVYDFRLWDRWAEALEPHGIRLLLILDYGNALYQGGFPPSTAQGRAAFAAFAGAAARHFKGRVIWEIWNEPNVPRYWVGTPNAEEYVALAREAALAIRREDPSAWILGPALGGGHFDQDYLEATFQAGLLEVVDAVSIHPYAAAEPEAAAALYATVRRMMRRQGRERPLAVTEWGYGTESLGAQAQAERLLRCLQVNRTSGVSLSIWYNWQDPVLPWSSYGLLDVHGQPKLAYRVLQSLEAVR